MSSEVQYNILSSFHEPKAPRPLPNLTQPGPASRGQQPLNLEPHEISQKRHLSEAIAHPHDLFRTTPTQSSAELLQPPRMPQDMPPTGGYEPVQYRRNLPVRGFRPAYYLVAMAGICSYGFYRVGQGIREQK